MARRYHDTVLPGKIRQYVCQETNREGGGVISSQMTKALRPSDRL